MASIRICQPFRNMNTLAHRGLSIGTINSSTIIATRHISLINATNLLNGLSNGMVIPASLTKMVSQKKPSLIQQQRRAIFNGSTLTKQQDMNQMQRRPYTCNANNETHKKIHDLITKNKSKGVFVVNSKRWFASDSLPKHIRVPLPALSPTMESGTIVSWEKKEGDRLNDGDLLAEIETDKATMGFETPEEGYLAKILVPAGTKNVPLGKLLCIIVDDEADIVKFKDHRDDGTIEPTPAAPQAQAAASSVPTSPPPPPAAATHQQPARPAIQQPMAEAAASGTPGGRLIATPFAKKLANQLGITLTSGSAGSGPHGRIVANDLEALAQQQSQQQPQTQSQPGGTSSSFSDISLTSMRQTIAKRLALSKQTIPHYYLTVNLNVDELLKLRRTVNDILADEGVKVSINDFITKAAALACRQVPEVNSAWHDTFIRQYHQVDVCVAVSTDNGLITPIVFGAETKGIKQISQETKGLADRARQGELQPHEFQGGTFTISNLGMFNIAHFAAVINPPQAAILAVGSTQKQVVPVAGSNDKSEVINTLNVTLSCDHRVVDGAVGAKWLGWFRQYIEKPFTMML